MGRKGDGEVHDPLNNQDLCIPQKPHHPLASQALRVRKGPEPGLVGNVLWLRLLCGTILGESEGNEGQM